MKKVRIGIFGFLRGANLVDYILQNNAEVVAVCDKRKDRLEKAKNKLGNMVTCYEDFDSFIEHDMDAVYIANYFHEHTEYIIKCLERNIPCASELLSNSTMAEGVKLVEAAEKSEAFFMLAENYPYMTFNREIKRVYEKGTLGKCLYAEGEYNHAGDVYDPATAKMLLDGEKHWRNFLARTYYVTHSLAPLMFATKANPVRVTAMPVYAPAPRDCFRASRVGDKAAIITTLNDDESVFKFVANSGFGASNNSYRLCCENGQIENLRGTEKIMLRYSPWKTPEGEESIQSYKYEPRGEDAELIKAAGHSGGDFGIIKEFIRCVRENAKPEFDVYFATRQASVAILAHRSLLQYGVPYDIPDFRNKEDRDKYRDDNLSPFYYSDGREPTLPCCSKPDFKPSEIQIANFRKALED